MSWSFETDPDFARELEWVDAFVREEVEPLDFVIEHPFDLSDRVRNDLIRPLQARVRDRRLWACHLDPELGGQGYGQVKLALLNEILGRSMSGPVVFGCQAPDSGNAEILARFGSDQLKARYLEPLLRNEIVSCYSMTELDGGSDPTRLGTLAAEDGSGWRITGEKWFSSHARFADFLVVMATTNPDAPPHQRASMFVVPRDARGVEIIRNVATFGDVHEGTHAFVRYSDVRIPADHLLGARGEGFAVAQTRLGGGRIHHAMRTVGLVRSALDQMCERALSRSTGGGLLADKQLIQEFIADSWVELEQFRLLVLQTAWKIDKLNDYRAVRKDISAVKAVMPAVLLNAARRALQVHGSLGISNEMPFGDMVMESFRMGIADGATEVHKVALAKQVLRSYKAALGRFPSGHLPTLRTAAITRYHDILTAAGGRQGNGTGD